MLEQIPVGVSLVIAGFFFAMSGVAIAASVHARRVAAAVESTRVANLSSAKEGVSAFEGKVASPKGLTLESTLTGARCAWFHVKVEKYVRRSPDRSVKDAWHTVVDYTSQEPFLIVDGTGKSAVYPDGAEVTPTDRSIWYGATPFPAERNPKRVLPGESTDGMLRMDGSHDRQFRYTEERIYDGDPLYVLGRLERGPIADDDDDFDPNGAELSKAVYGVDADDLAPYSEDTWKRQSRYREAASSVKAAAKARIVAGASGAGRFLISTTPRDTMVTMNRGGANAALFVAAVPAAIGLLFLWARFAS